MRGVALANGKNPDEVLRGANALLNTLERTGRTPGVGSQTQPRQEMAKELGRTYIGDLARSVSSNPLNSWSHRLNDWIMRGRYQDLAQALTAPDSVQQLVKLAKVRPNSLTASYYAASLLGLDRAIAGGQ